MKECSTCKSMKPLTEYYKRSDTKSGIEGSCKTCCNAKVYEAREAFKVKCVEYMGGECQSCGYNRCISALEFHHKDPSQKDFEINKGRMTSFKNAQNELNKCVMLCSNCHKEAHAGILDIGSLG